jgi:hypothetical protein
MLTEQHRTLIFPGCFAAPTLGLLILAGSMILLIHPSDLAAVVGFVFAATCGLASTRPWGGDAILVPLLQAGVTGALAGVIVLCGFTFVYLYMLTLGTEMLADAMGSHEPFFSAVSYAFGMTVPELFPGILAPVMWASTMGGFFGGALGVWHKEREPSHEVDRTG